jgi:hypothetical protein
MAKTEHVLFLMKNFIAYVEQLSDEEIEKLIAKQAKFIFEDIDLNKKITKKNAKSAPKVVEPVLTNEAIIYYLKNLSDRNEGDIFLRKHCKTKAPLQEVAKALDILNAKDNKEMLIKKIIERTIGFRLRSQSIQSS